MSAFCQLLEIFQNFIPFMMKPYGPVENLVLDDLVILKPAEILHCKKGTKACGEWQCNCPNVGLLSICKNPGKSVLHPLPSPSVFFSIMQDDRPAKQVPGGYRLLNKHSMNRGLDS